jgi:hypothetical protein
MGWRKGHGNGKGQPRIETLPADELPTPNAATTVASLAERRARGKPFEPGNRAAVGRRPKLALLGVDVDRADPRMVLALRRANRYRKQRCAELSVTFGGCSAGVSGLVASASLALCASRFLYELGAELGDAELLKRASSLANDARQNELAAWELASREGKARPAPKGDAPWMIVATEEPEE